MDFCGSTRRRRERTGGARAHLFALLRAAEIEELLRRLSARPPSVSSTGSADWQANRVGNPANVAGVVPLVVVEGTVSDFTVAVEQVRAAGWQVRRGWDEAPPAGPTAPVNQTGLFGHTHHAPPVDLVLAGVVADERAASAAMLAALTGAGLVVHGRAPREVLDRLCDDLRRLGRLDHRPVGERAVTRFDEFDGELLGLLAAGLSVGRAAARLYVSRRTADRRLADIRLRLGVRSTAEALLVFGDQSPPIEPAPGRITSNQPPA